MTTLTVVLVAAMVAPALAGAVGSGRPRPSEDRASRPPRTVVVTGSYGAGHDVAAGRIVRALTAAGRRVELLDIVDAYPLGAGRVLRRWYFAQLTACPRTWEWVLRALSSESAWGRRATAAISYVLAVCIGPVLAHQPMVVVVGESGHLQATAPSLGPWTPTSRRPDA